MPFADFGAGGQCGIFSVLEKAMKKIGVIANCSKPQAASVLKRLATKASELGLELIASEETARLLPGVKRVSEESLNRRIDILMALGGDGSMLHAVRVLRGADIPVLGVNLGSLGFMTSVTQENLEHALEILASGKFMVSERAVADCQILRGRKQIGRHRALNDVVMGWGTSSRMISLELSIDNECVSCFSCDGMIISTPTGSTGHSLSAGGPIMVPGASAFVISVICPHTLSNRPLVVSNESLLSIRVAHSMKKLLLSIDGQEELTLTKDDRILIKKSERGVHFVHLPGYSYFSVLRQKLHWRGSSV
jgi:NAD+ kinase